MQSVEASVLLMVNVVLFLFLLDFFFFKKQGHNHPTNAAHCPGAFRSALVLQIEAKYIFFLFCKTTNPLNIKMSKEIFFF